MSSNAEDVSQASRSKLEGAKTSVAVSAGTKKRVDKTVTLRKSNRLELMTKRRMENDTDDENDNNSNNGNNNGPAGRGSHRYHEQALEPQELMARMEEFIIMMRTDPDSAAAAVANLSEEDRQGVSAQAAAAAAHAVAVQRISDGLKYTRQLLRLDHLNPFSEFRRFGGVPVLLRLVDCPNNEICYNAVWCLTTLTNGSTEDVECVMSEGIIPKMVACLLHPTSERVRNQAAWCLGNLIGDGSAHRDAVLRFGGMQAVLALLRGRCSPDGRDGEFRNEKVITVRNAVWVIAQLCRFRPAPPLSQVAVALPALNHLLASHDDQEVLDDALWAVSFITDGMPERMEAVLNMSDIMRSVVSTFQDTVDVPEEQDGPTFQVSPGRRFTAVLPCLRIFGNFTSKEETTQLVFDWGVIPLLAPFLQPQMDRAIRKEACWILSNALAGTEDQAKAVLDAQLVPLLVRNIDVPEFEVKKEATWAIANLATFAPEDVIRYLVETCQVLDPLSRVLRVPEERSNHLALEALEPIFRAGVSFMANNSGRNPYADRFDQLGGVERLHELISHTSNCISMQCAELLRNFFSEDADDVDASDGHWGHDPSGNNSNQQGGHDQQPDGYNRGGGSRGFGN